MVDALSEARRVVRKGGLVVDARPESRVLAWVEHRGRRVGAIRTRREELGDDRAADRAVARLKGEGQFRSVGHGRFWHRVDFTDLAELQAYLRGHLRFVPRADWRVSAATRRGWRADPFVTLRAVRYELLERTERP